MGLAPYGIRGSERVESYKKLIREKLVDIKDDGSIHLDQTYFNYAVGLRMAKDSKWQQLFGFRKRSEEDTLTQEHCDLALAIQEVTEDVVMKMAKEAKRLTHSDNLCMAGGVALNCVANGKLLREGIFKNIWIQPASGDAGGAVGAALAAEYIYGKTSRIADGINDTMQGSYLGPEYTDTDTIEDLRQYTTVYKQSVGDQELCETVAGLIASGHVVGWCQGRSEFGPRALGNRSILADPRNPAMQQKMNVKIKQREGFRPFAPSVAEEDAAKYFDIDVPSPYMLLVADVAKGIWKPLPENYSSMPMMERLYVQRSELPAITHVDMSARVQTVSTTTNPLYHRLIKAFEAKTRCGVLINTSFNIRGEPPVQTPTDAYRCFMTTDMDVLVVGHCVFLKSEQPKWTEKERKKGFILD
jgi:carbamoyltransferase